MAMRARLLKCSAEQVRPATRSETIGAELLDSESFDRLREDIRNPARRSGAIDVSAEGPPPPEAWDGPETAPEPPPEPAPRPLSVLPLSVMAAAAPSL